MDRLDDTRTQRSGITATRRLTVAMALGAALLAASAGAARAAEWGYESGEVQPPDWGTIAGAEACGTGQAQSPIDFSQSRLAPSKTRPRLKSDHNLEFAYGEAPLSIKNNGHTVEAEWEPGSTLRLEGNGPLFNVVQFHFHAPSEHAFEQGALFDAELHIVHRSTADPSQLAVVGLLIKEGAENQALKPLFDHLGDVMNEGDTFENAAEHIDLAAVLPDDQRFFAYRGSLTTPPCAEVVQWRVIRKPIELSRAQINAFIDVLRNSCCPEKWDPLESTCRHASLSIL